MTSDNKITILDGGMSRELQRIGAPFRQPEWSALALMETPALVKAVHKAFITHGAHVITSNSYALVPFHIGTERFKQHGQALAARAGEMARDAVIETGTQSTTRVAGSIPPLFGSYRADLYEPDRVTEIAGPLIEGLNPYVDVWLCETQSIIDEAQRVKRLIDQIDTEHKPVWTAFTLIDYEPTPEPLLRSGERVEDAVKAMADIGIRAILFNCCVPEAIQAALRVARKTLQTLPHTGIQTGAYANAFAPQAQNAIANEGISAVRQDLTPIAYRNWAQQWQSEGASIIGGCCGVGVKHIAELAQTFC
ncbi:MAG: homocysteine S-methyltransferase family protein [Gammaproteobacteria bacterium]